jgi:hypothetical protein
MPERQLHFSFAVSPHFSARDLLSDQQGAKAAMKRERNAKDAKGNGKSQTKIVCFPYLVLFISFPGGPTDVYGI